ncbi:hypothetical protein CPB85DRAFT_379348 [Mucidula mucida]|nr:hypothetical protein CPB85DRAFT_379348 [Mucidula mucida]
MRNFLQQPSNTPECWRMEVTRDRLDSSHFDYSPPNTAIPIPRVVVPLSGWSTPVNQLDVDQQPCIAPKSNDEALQISEANVSTLTNESELLSKDVWRTYAKDAYHYDKIRFEFWNRRLDIQLLFAGIFSAIVIPLIAETYVFLTEPGPPGYAIRINMMFAISLVVSIATAVYCLHCKQWLDGYDLDVLRRSLTGDTRDLITACRTRQYRYRALERYQIPRIMGLGALFLYIAIITFSIGLVDFFCHMYPPIGIIVASTAGVFVLLHIITSVQPCFSPDSPFKSPFSYLLANSWRGAVTGNFSTPGQVELWELEDISKWKESLDDDIQRWVLSDMSRKQRNMSI